MQKMYFDAHTHLNDPKIFPDYEKYLEIFFQNGWLWLVNIGVNDKRNDSALAISQKYHWKNFVKFTVGFHPHDVITDYNSIHMEKISFFCSQYPDLLAGIGECWIDLHYDWSRENLELQKLVFAKHCQLAREFNMPLIVHSRDWFYETLDVLKDYKDLKIYFHCWWYWPQELKRLLDFGIEKLFVGFAGNVTYPKALALKESLQICPLDQLLLETDAPYLTPQVKRWEVNYPHFVKYVYDYVWEYLWISQPRLQEIVKDNFFRLYG